MSRESHPVPAPGEVDPPDGSAVAVPAGPPGRLRIQAQVALALLEAVRDGDRPEEVMDEENVTITIPRRLGLSTVVDSQIRRYEDEARRRRRIPESEVQDLMRLMARRPDAGALFYQVGRGLEAEGSGPILVRALPTGVAAALARKRVAKRLRELFGTALVRMVGKPFEVEAVHGVLTAADPGGKACALVTGLADSVLERYRVGPGRVIHSTCRAFGEERCRWIFAPTEE
jgi:hypothetical protein